MAAAGVFFHWPQVYGVLLLFSLSLKTLPAAAETRRNHYETLHVEPTATDSQIKKSFRKLALKFHPDKSKGANAEKSFRDIVEAYQVLSNKEKRRLYDSEGHAAFRQDSTAARPMDEPVDDPVFTLTDLFHGSGCPLFTQPSSHWTLNHFEDEDDYFYQYSSSAFNFFIEDENEDILY